MYLFCLKNDVDFQKIHLDKAEQAHCGFQNQKGRSSSSSLPAASEGGTGSEGRGEGALRC
jgi:hypothetical protein